MMWIECVGYEHINDSGIRTALIPGEGVGYGMFSDLEEYIDISID